MKRFLCSAVGCLCVLGGELLAQHVVQEVVNELPTLGEGAFVRIHGKSFRVFAVGQEVIDDLKDGDSVLQAERAAAMQAKKALSSYISQELSSEESLQTEFQNATKNSEEGGKQTEESSEYSFENFSSDIKSSSKNMLQRVETIKTIHAKEEDITYAKVLICFTYGKHSSAQNASSVSTEHPAVKAPKLPKHEWIVCVGRGNSRDQAIRAAIVEGVQQVYGTYLENDSTYKSRFARLKVNGNSHKESGTEQTSKTLTSTKGFVNAYRIISVEVVEQNIYQAKINAEFVNPRAGGLRAVMLYPMEMPIDKETNNYKVAPGMRISGKELGKLCVTEFEKAFTEANKFLVLNQEDMLQAVQEHNLTSALVDNGIASPAEMVKAGKLLTADYIVKPAFDYIAYSKKLKFNKKAGKFAPNERLVFKFSYTMFDVKSGQRVKNSRLEVVIDNEIIQNIRAEDEERNDDEIAHHIFRATMDMAVKKLYKDAKIY